MLTTQIMSFFIKNFFCKHDQIRIWSHYLKKSLMQNFILCAVAYHYSRVRGPIKFRSSPSQMFFKKGVLKNFVNFSGKHLCWSLFFNIVAGIQTCYFIKKRLQHRCFPVKFAKFLRIVFFTEHLLVVASENWKPQ